MSGVFLGLRESVARRDTKLAVVGLGFVGTPVACRFASVGFSVVGVDVDADKVAAISEGHVPFEGAEPGLQELLHKVLAAGRLRATTDYGDLDGVGSALIAVETPVDPASRKPAYEALKAALAALGSQLGRGSLVVVESTLAPGTMARVVTPALEAASGLTVGEDILLAHCPERVMPGRLLRNLATLSRVVGGTTPEAAEVAAELYAHVVEADLDVTDALTAEIVKTAENAYRDVQIAFANEVALLCEDLGANAWTVRELVNKSPGRAMLLPGGGVGGHCIPKDPWLLVANAGADFQPRLIPAARAVNDGMPSHVADMVGRALAGLGIDITQAVVALLGYAYLEESSDERNSPSGVLAGELRSRGAEVRIHDPWVAEYRGRTVAECVAGCDAVVVMIGHRAYRELDWAALGKLVRTTVLVDARHVVDAAEAGAAGWRVCAVGTG